MAKYTSSQPSQPPPDSPYRPRIKRSMIWHPGHCTRSFIVTDFYGDLNALIVEHGEVIKCCGQFWKANRRYGQQDGTDNSEEPHAIYKRYKLPTINEIDVSTIARPLNRCQCKPSSTIPRSTSTSVPLIPGSSSSLTRNIMSNTTTMNTNTRHTTAANPPISQGLSLNTQLKSTPAHQATTSAIYSPTEYTVPEISHPRPPPVPPSAYRDPVIALSGRLPLDRTKAHVTDSIGSALGKFMKGKEKEKEKDKERRSGSKSPSLWGCIGEDGEGIKQRQSGGGEGRSQGCREEGCQHVFYCSHCGEMNSVWSDRRMNKE
ncbi:hypothetical protein TWF718_004017 [Orbilia javanica]|uniref:Uncharacterized protein n=1 Tax=Orbilia javanica TaxID=47235 RepID=A0AAN8MX94_9PEZI